MLKFKYDMLKGNGSKFYKELGFDPQEVIIEFEANDLCSKGDIFEFEDFEPNNQYLDDGLVGHFKVKRYIDSQNFISNIKEQIQGSNSLTIDQYNKICEEEGVPTLDNLTTEDLYFTPVTLDIYFAQAELNDIPTNESIRFDESLIKVLHYAPSYKHATLSKALRIPEIIEDSDLISAQEQSIERIYFEGEELSLGQRGTITIIE